MTGACCLSVSLSACPSFTGGPGDVHTLGTATLPCSVKACQTDQRPLPGSHREVPGKPENKITTEESSSSFSCTWWTSGLWERGPADCGTCPRCYSIHVKSLLLLYSSPLSMGSLAMVSITHGHHGLKILNGEFQK